MVPGNIADKAAMTDTIKLSGIKSRMGTDMFSDRRHTFHQPIIAVMISLYYYDFKDLHRVPYL